MRIPYIVGRWVRGQNHYGRHRLVDYLLTVPDSATWLVGTRRMGKTSLLRQLEYVTTTEDSQYVPLIWDLQGCQRPEDMSAELAYAIADGRTRFQALGIDSAMVTRADAIAQLRTLRRNTEAVGKQLLVLVDEAEALLYIADTNPGWLAMLRKVMQEANMRSVITSTKLLARLNEISADWTTSPFFFGFNLANLWQLDLVSAYALIRQEQSHNRVMVEDELADDILSYTNGHPYLIQHLCQRLFTVDDRGRGLLRSVRDEDLDPDHILAGFFRIDFQYLTQIERRLMLTVADLSVASRNDMLAVLSDERPGRVDMFLYGLRKLGYLRAVHDRWAVGNEYLRRWIRDQRMELRSLADSAIDDSVHEQILRAERRNEVAFLRHEIERLQEELDHIAEKPGRERARPVGARNEDEARIREDLVRAHRELDRISRGE
jgi:hypothetical protein